MSQIAALPPALAGRGARDDNVGRWYDTGDGLTLSLRGNRLKAIGWRYGEADFGL